MDATRQSGVQGKALRLLRLCQSFFCKASGPPLSCWVLVAFASGIAATYSSFFKLGPVSGCVAIFAGVCLFLRLSPISRTGRAVVLLVLLFSFFAAGAGYAQWRMDKDRMQVLQRPMQNILLRGIVVRIERSSPPRYVLRSVEHTQQPLLPANIRLNAPPDSLPLRLGQGVTLRAHLYPLSLPVMPGGFDYGRYLYERGIGATGVLLRIIATDEARDERQNMTGWERLGLAFQIWRQDLVERMDRVESLPHKGIFKALLFGRSAEVAPETAAILRQTGTAHILAISGLHMSLVGGGLFIGLRFVFLLFSLRWRGIDAKKCAAGAALIGCSCYFILSGGSVSVQRAFIMIAIFFCAILADRRALSMHNLVVAGWIILLYRPSSVTAAGMQLSFAAAAALIAAANAAQRLPPGWRGLLAHMPVGVATASLVASIAVAMPAAYHFGTVFPYGVLANLVMLPVLSLWILPLSFLDLATSALQSGIFLQLAGWGMQAMVAAGSFFASYLPAGLHIAPMQPLFYALGYASLLLAFAASLRLAPFFLASAVFFAITATQMLRIPDIILAENGGNVFVRIDATEKRPFYAVYDRRRSRFLRRVLKERYAIAAPFPRLQDVGNCDHQGCSLQTGWGVITLLNATAEIAYDCRNADLIVLLGAAVLPAECAAYIIRGQSESGTGFLYLGEGSPKIKRAGSVEDNFPWRQSGSGRQ